MSDSETRFTVKDSETPDQPVRLDFSTFVLSLATSGMLHLGVAPLEEGGDPPEPNLPLAQQVIDTLDMLQDKTRGNLGDEESKLLQSVLYELRMSFVKAREAARAGGGEPEAEEG